MPDGDDLLLVQRYGADPASAGGELETADLQEETGLFGERPEPVAQLSDTSRGRGSLGMISPIDFEITARINQQSS